ncbi:protein kinase domain-containing protein [Acinetobacter higginsii]|uniref:protein kinase domain-containing protein n=1 Tax=Acinetobacter higginsii TaxID=70347 RepID=UPI001F4A9FC3|nr:serine/threonine-protein kinase [Acinetobacter higginsii]MCH7295557.1 protein kinase [Acinetobacter higginsii]
MSFTTWISNPKIQLNDLNLVTKAQSYAFGRRVYTFQVDQQRYWLKFHNTNDQPVLAQAFQRELAFYQHCQQHEQAFLLPFQMIPLRHLINGLDEDGIGVITVDSHDFFAEAAIFENIEQIKQKIFLALDALDALHQFGWVHGDLKAEHFRFYENSCRLIDFEQSFRIGHPIHTLDATPHYMAPELFQGAGKSIQSDLYALGIIVYEWLTQSRLKVSTYHDWAVLHCQQLHIQLPSTLQCFFPLLNGLTQKHIKQRFNSVLVAKDCLKQLDML